MASVKINLKEDDIITLAEIYLVHMLTFKPAYDIPPGVERIDVKDLKVGMTVYKETAKGKLIPDCHLLSYFPTSNGALSFRTAVGQLVIWRPCGKVWVRNGEGV